MNNDFNNFEDYSNVKEIPWWGKLRDIFVDPKTLFKSLKFYPNLKLSIIVIVLATIIGAALQINSEEFINTVLGSIGGVKPSDSTLNIYVYLTIALIPVIPLFTLLFKGFMISGLSVLVGGDSDFKDAVIITTYSYIPVAVGGMVLSFISFVFGINPIELSLAQILPESMIGTLFYGVAISMNLLIIWYEILSVIGTIYIFEIPKKKALIPVIVPWIIWVILYAGLHVISYGSM